MDITGCCSEHKTSSGPRVTDRVESHSREILAMRTVTVLELLNAFWVEKKCNFLRYYTVFRGRGWNQR